MNCLIQQSSQANWPYAYINSFTTETSVLRLFLFLHLTSTSWHTIVSAEPIISVFNEQLTNSLYVQILSFHTSSTLPSVEENTQIHFHFDIVASSDTPLPVYLCSLTFWLHYFVQWLSFMTFLLLYHSWWSPLHDSVITVLWILLDMIDCLD